MSMAGQHRTSWITRFLRWNRGQALIETALVVPFLALILVGGVELARIEYASIEVANAAKAFVQYGSQGLGTFGDWNGMETAARDDSANITITNFNYWYTYACSDGSVVAAASDCSSSTTTYYVINVDITASFDTLLHFPSLPSTITLHGHATQTVLEGF